MKGTIRTDVMLWIAIMGFILAILLLTTPLAYVIVGGIK